MNIINVGNIIMNTYVYPCPNGYIMIDTGYEHSLNNVIFCGDAAMNGFPSIKRLIIWIEDKTDFEKSWDVLLAEDANTIYPAHGRPFPKYDLAKFKKYISRIRLYKLK